MIRRIFLSLALLAVCAYLTIALTAFNRPPATVCTGIELRLRDSANRDFISTAEVKSLLRKAHLYPEGEPLASVRTDALEETLSHHPLIDDVQCYKTLSGQLCIEVSQRIPILQVVPLGGASYYIDSKGRSMPAGPQVAAHVAIATGHIMPSMAAGPLYEFACFLREDPFWQAQVEQINVASNGGVELVPRVGQHLIYLGPLTDWEQKLDRVKRFYRQAISRVGWNKYARISVEFNNQIICTKKE